MSIIDESNIPDDENTSRGKVYNWSDKMHSRTKIVHTDHKQR